MMPELSPNTQAILLLTAPLIAGRVESKFDLLSPGEYKRLAKLLREIQRQPSDLITSNADDILASCQAIIDKTRLKSLLGRGFLLSQAFERWQSRAIWVVSRADTSYPRLIKSRLHEDAPAIIYGCGDAGLLGTMGLGVVGSRNVSESLIDYTKSIGELAARAGVMLVSGGAKGIDQAAMTGALEAGGTACGVLADSLEKTSVNRTHRNLLMDGQLVLISPYDPSAGFNVGNAMQRNKLIYALSEASLVVNSDLKKGGTWSGAVEQLDKLKFGPLFVRSTGEASDGLEALKKKGAISWPNPTDVDSFLRVFTLKTSVVSKAKPLDTSLFDQASSDEQIKPSSEVIKVKKVDTSRSKVTLASATQELPADIIFDSVRKTLVTLLLRPMNESEVAKALNVNTPQAKAWLQQLAIEGHIMKQKKPLRYVSKKSAFL